MLQRTRASMRWGCCAQYQTLAGEAWVIVGRLLQIKVRRAGDVPSSICQEIVLVNYEQRRRQSARSASPCHKPTPQQEVPTFIGYPSAQRSARTYCISSVTHWNYVNAASYISSWKSSLASLTSSAVPGYLPGPNQLLSSGEKSSF